MMNSTTGIGERPLPYVGPATLYLTDDDVLFLAEGLVHDNRPEAIDLRRRMRDYLNLRADTNARGK